MKRVVVLGAGISGLSTAWFLKQRFKDNIELTVLEKSPHVGGWIKTIRKNGFLFELGPHSFRAAGGETTLQLIEQLSMQDQVIPAHAASRKRYFYCNQQLKQLPYNFWSGLASPFTYKLISAVLRDYFTSPKLLEDESIQSFATRRFGKIFTEEFIDPLVSGIYAGDIAALSLKSCFPKWHQWEQKYHSIIKGAFAKEKKATELPPWMNPIKQAGIYTLRDGMHRLPNALGKKLESHITFNCSATTIHCQQDKIEVTTSKGNTLQADFVFSALPPAALSGILTQNHADTAALIKVSSASVAVVCLGYKKSLLKQSGFGYLVPSKEKESVLGVIWDSSVFPEQNSHSEETRLSVMLGGIHHPDIALLSQNEIYKIALDAVKRHLGITDSPEAFHIKIAMDAIPQYNVGHSQQMQLIEEGVRKLSSQLICLGNAFGGVSINDCITNSKFIVGSLEHIS